MNRKLQSRKNFGKMLKLNNDRLLIFVCLFLFQILLSWIISSQANATLCSFEKDYPYGYESRLDPNVLILIDTSGSMTESAVNLQNTYGDGTKPFRHENHQNDGYQLYFGDDVFDQNNDPLGEYYHPDLKYITLKDFQNAFGIDYGPGEDPYYGLLNRYPYQLSKIQAFFQSDRCDFQNPYDENETPTQWIRKADYFRQVSWSQYLDRFTDYWYSDSLSYFGQPTYTEDEDPLFKPGTSTRYRYPNDSRLYQVRVILDRLFNQPTLVDGLRIGLATFCHDNDWVNYLSGYYFGYQWEPYNGSNQYITQSPSKTSDSLTWPADPRMRYLSNNIDVLWDQTEAGQYEKNQPYFDDLVKWFDGVESTLSGNEANPEIRGFGGTPIYHAFAGLPEIYDPDDSGFNGNTDPTQRIVQNWCQHNWIILLTDGEDSDYGSTSMGEVVEALYKLKPEYKNSLHAINNTRGHGNWFC